MTTQPDFFVESRSVAGAYDDVLVPAMFEPWAERLLAAHGPWAGEQVLDLGTGTGIVARKLADEVGDAGAVVGVDPSETMLSLAKVRCADVPDRVTLMESPAHPLDLPPETFDAIVCQQAFQFFPDRAAAAGEMHRTVKVGGRAVVSAWTSLEHCPLFAAMADTLRDIEQPEIAEQIRMPFDFLPADEFRGHFEAAGFEDIRIETEAHDLVLPHGIGHGIKLAYSTPVAPDLLALPEETQQAFRQTFADRLSRLTTDGRTMGSLEAHVLTARRAA